MLFAGSPNWTAIPIGDRRLKSPGQGSEAPGWVGGWSRGPSLALPRASAMPHFCLGIKGFATP